MTRDFEVVSNGFQPLLLGMTRPEIDSVLGEMSIADHYALEGEGAFRYEVAPVRFVIRAGRAVELGITPPATVLFQGRSLFDDFDAWRHVIAEDGDPQEVLGFVILRKLGLTLTGFHDGDRGQLAVTAFEPGRWDLLRDKMKPLRL